MNSWFRSWHGAPTDPKWLAIARRTQTNAGMVSAVFWALLDCASQANERGDVSSFDVESYAAFSGWAEHDIAAIIGAFGDKKIIDNNKLQGWEKRQPKREDGSAERAKDWRERKRTQTNANEHREEKIREDKNKRESSSPKIKSPKRKTELPADFAPDWQAALDLGLTKVEAEREFQKFKNHASMNARTAVRWNGAWMNWCIKAAEFMGKSPPGESAAPITEEEKQKLFAELRQ